ncbi:TBC1 domain family member 31 [Camelus dromedarius]|uniref:TBC1 domain family member 31 n=1 Tax=Camelus dromedarius TaxID=9838 RepID=A0A5N4CGP3_CAMDR|nr:TBC1 domain family member 31 [Camelus dromedarius]
MQSTDLGNKESGKIWHRKPSPAARDGIIVNIVHNTSDYLPKVLRFLNVAFDSTGDCLIAGDHQGNIYVFDLSGNRFNLVQRTAQACTALAFNLRRKSEFLVALADYSIKCFDTVTKELVSWMRGHESSVFSISVHASGKYAITTSSDTAQLWDLDTFQRKRKLNILQSVGIQKVFFLPLSNTILSCFKDNSIFAWECDTLICKYQLPAPPESSNILYKVFAVTRLDTLGLYDCFCSQISMTVISQIWSTPSHVVLKCEVSKMCCLFSVSLLAIHDYKNAQVYTKLTTHAAFLQVPLSCHWRISGIELTPPPPLVKVIEDLPKKKVNSGDLKVKVKSGRIQRPAKSRESKAQTRILKQDLAGNFENKENELSDGLNKKRLQILLKSYGEYPTKYRTLSALAHWSTIFSDTPYLPLLAFPFVKLFQNNQLVCFEVVATLIINWCQHWFEYFPNPPINILGMIENVLAFHDKELLQHFIDHDVTSQLYAWPLLETVFSEVLTREEWLKLFDNVFSNHPSFLLMTIVAYNICSRAPLLHCNLKDDFEYFFHHRNNLDISAVIREVYHLMDTTPTDIHPDNMLNAFVALTKGQYPVFNQYPKFIVDYQTQERERIRNDELDYLRERQTVEDMQAEVDQQRVEDEAWYHKQELLRKAEETRREMLLQEEEKIIQQRQRLAAVKRELKVKEMHLQDAARRRLLKLQQDQQEMELRRLDDEMERKVHMRDREIAATAKDLEMRHLELESQKRLYEKQLSLVSEEPDVKSQILPQDLLLTYQVSLCLCNSNYRINPGLQKNLARNQEAVAKEMREDADAYRRKVDLEENMFHRLIGTDQTQNEKTQKLIEENLAEAEQVCLNTDWRIQALHKQRCNDLHRNECYQEMAKLLRKNRRKEIEVLDAMMEAETKKWEEAEEKDFHLKSGKKAAALSDASRKWFLEKEINDAAEHAQHLCGRDEEKEKAECRDERRIKFKEEKKAKKEAEKKAKADAKQKEEEAKEKQRQAELEAAQLAKEKEEEEVRQQALLAKKEKDIQKKSH